MAQQQLDVEQVKQIIENGIAQAQELMSDPAKVEQLLKDLQQKVKELPSTAADALGTLPLMASMVKSYVTKEYADVSPKVVATVVSALIYLVKRNDIIDDTVPVLGLADDLAVVALALKVNEKELNAYQAWREANQLPEASIEA